MKIMCYITSKTVIHNKKKSCKKLNLFYRKLATKVRYLNFRPYVDEMKDYEKEFKDSGYYFKQSGNECTLIKFTLLDNGFQEAYSNSNWLILISSGSIKQELYKNLRKYQKVNHFPSSTELTRKDLLYKNVLKSHLKNNIKIVSFVPHSYILPQDYCFMEEVCIRINKHYLGYGKGPSVYMDSKANCF